MSKSIIYRFLHGSVCRCAESIAQISQLRLKLMRPKVMRLRLAEVGAGSWRLRLPIHFARKKCIQKGCSAYYVLPRKLRNICKNAIKIDFQGPSRHTQIGQPILGIKSARKKDAAHIVFNQARCATIVKMQSRSPSKDIPSKLKWA